MYSESLNTMENAYGTGDPTGFFTAGALQLEVNKAGLKCLMYKVMHFAPKRSGFFCPTPFTRECLCHCMLGI